LDFNVTKKPDLALIAMEFFQRNYLLSLAFLGIITKIYKWMSKNDYFGE
jgi:hypothetical protein